MGRLSLPDVTLCAAASVNVAATVAALQRCIDHAKFGRILLFTDQPVATPGDIERIEIEPLTSARDYSHFLLRGLAPFIRTSHCLVVQWDGFIVDPAKWDQAFLGFDYIGAPWPQFGDGHDVGNGGFSLRSRRLIDACMDPDFQIGHPEDIAIGRTNRIMLEGRHGLRFADRATASRFAFERSASPGGSFGFHGIFNMIPAIGADAFWDLYRSLDDRSTITPDFARIVAQLGRGPASWPRKARLAIDRLRLMFRR